MDKTTVRRQRQRRVPKPTIKRKDARIDESLLLLDDTCDTIDPRNLPEPVLREKRQIVDMIKMHQQEFQNILDKKVKFVNEMSRERPRLLKLPCCCKYHSTNTQCLVSEGSDDTLLLKVFLSHIFSVSKNSEVQERCRSIKLG